MEIRLRPELEEMIKQDLARGPYETADDFVAHAVALLHEQENWLAEHATEIRQKIAAGYASAQRGDLLDTAQVRSSMQARKHEWLANKNQK